MMGANFPPARRVRDPPTTPDVHRARRFHDPGPRRPTSAATLQISALRTIALRPVAAPTRRYIAMNSFAFSFVPGNPAAFMTIVQSPPHFLPAAPLLRNAPAQRRRPLRRCSFRIALRDIRMRLPSTRQHLPRT